MIRSHHICSYTQVKTRRKIRHYSSFSAFVTARSPKNATGRRPPPAINGRFIPIKRNPVSFQRDAVELNTEPRRIRHDQAAVGKRNRLGDQVIFSQQMPDNVAGQLTAGRCRRVHAAHITHPQVHAHAAPGRRTRRACQRRPIDELFQRTEQMIMIRCLQS